MSYDARGSVRHQHGVLTDPISLTATGVVDDFSYVTFETMRVWRFMAYVVNATVSTGNIVVQLLYRPVYGSSSNQVTIASLNIPGGVTADKIYYKDFAAVTVPAGNEVAFNISVAAAGGGAAGTAIAQFLADYSPEAALNQTKFVLST